MVIHIYVVVVVDVVGRLIYHCIPHAVASRLTHCWHSGRDLVTLLRWTFVGYVTLVTLVGFVVGWLRYVGYGTHTFIYRLISGYPIPRWLRWVDHIPHTHCGCCTRCLAPDSSWIPYVGGPFPYGLIYVYLYISLPDLYSDLRSVVVPRLRSAFPFSGCGRYTFAFGCCC